MATAPPVTAAERRRGAPAARTLVLLGVPTALAAVLVLWGLGRLPLWRDEVASVTIADRPLGSLWHVVAHHEANMALYDALLAAWTTLGHGEGLLRLPSALLAIATVPVAALAARRIAGDLAAAVTGGLLALNGMVLTYGQQVRGYALMMFLAAVAALALLRIVGDGTRRGDWIAWTAAIALLPYAHLLGGLVVVALTASLVAAPRDRLDLRPLAGSLVAAGLTWLPMALFAAAGDNNRTTWVEPLGQALVRRTAVTMAGSTALAIALAVAVGVVALGSAALARRRDAEGALRRWQLALVGAWVVVPPVLLGLICLRQQMWVDRYLIGIVPGLAVAAGVAVALVRERLGGGAAAAGVAVLAALALQAAATTAHPAPGPGEDLRGAARHVLAGARPGDAIIYVPAFARVGVDYYLVRSGTDTRPRDALLARSAVARGDLFGSEVPAGAVAARLAGARRVWVVGYGWGAGGWHPTPEPALAAAPAVLHRDFHRAQQRRFGVVDVELFTR